MMPERPVFKSQLPDTVTQPWPDPEQVPQPSVRGALCRSPRLELFTQVLSSQQSADLDSMPVVEIKERPDSLPIAKSSKLVLLHLCHMKLKVGKKLPSETQVRGSPARRDAVGAPGWLRHLGNCLLLGS